MCNTIELQNRDRQVDRILVALGDKPNVFLVGLVGDSVRVYQVIGIVLCRQPGSNARQPLG
jgi:hypothetical protein